MGGIHQIRVSMDPPPATRVTAAAARVVGQATEKAIEEAKGRGALQGAGRQPRAAPSSDAKQPGGAPGPTRGRQPVAAKHVASAHSEGSSVGSAAGHSHTGSPVIVPRSVAVAQVCFLCLRFLSLSCANSKRL